MRKILYILTCWSITTLCYAQIKFTTQCPKNIDINSTFKVKYIINTIDATDFEGPDFKNFDCLHGPASSVYQSYQSTSSGKVSSNSSITYTYILSPREGGQYQIPGAVIKVNGKIYKSASVKVNVTGKKSNGKKTPIQNEAENQIQNVGRKITNKDLYFTVTTNKKEAYEQEPIVLTYKFYSKVGVHLSNIMLKSRPDLKGFLSQEVTLSEGMEPTTEEVDGSLYRVGTNLQYVLFPQNEGILEIPSVDFNCEVLQRDNKIDLIDAFFNGVGNISRKIERTTPVLNIKVRPLPSPKPAYFSGGVGNNLQIKTELLTRSPKTHELCTYRITISGSGNLQLIKAPQIDFPKDFDVYPPKTIDETTLTAEGVTGMIHFDYTFVPKNIGEYTIPSSDFVYFDCNQEKYVSLTTDDIKLHIAKGDNNIQDVESEWDADITDIKPLHISKLNHQNNYFSYGTWLYILIHLFILVFFISIYFLVRRYKTFTKSKSRQQKRARKTAENNLTIIYSKIDKANVNDFYVRLKQILYTFIQERLHIDAMKLSKEEFRVSLIEKKVSEATIDDCIKIIEECEYANFAPGTSLIDKKVLYEQAIEIINKIDNYDNN